eukprot:RCo052315
MAVGVRVTVEVSFGEMVNEAVLVQLTEALREVVVVELEVKLVLTEGVCEGVLEFEKEKLRETEAELWVGVEDREGENEPDPELDKEIVPLGDKLFEPEGVALELSEELVVKLPVRETVGLREALTEHDKLKLRLPESEKESEGVTEND